MENTDQSQGVDMNPPNSSSSALRWVMRISLTLCGLMIAAVLLSQPRAAPYVQAGLDKVHGIMSSFMPDKNQQEQIAELATPIDTADETASEPTPVRVETSFSKPTVTVMPTSRMPVRRLAITRED